MKTALLLTGALALFATPALARTQDYVVIAGGKNVGHLTATIDGTRTAVDFNVKNNGRGPMIAETIVTDAAGMPIAWDVTGATTFGSKVAEHFARTGTRAEWTDSTGKGGTTLSAPAVYVTQAGSPYAYQLLATLLLKAPGMTMAALPGGTLTLTKGETLSVAGPGGPKRVTRYSLGGIGLSPDEMLLEPDGTLFAALSASSITIAKGYEGEEVRLRERAAQWEADRYVAIERDVAHRYPGPVRIRNVHVFDAKAARLGPLVSVLVNGREIASIEPLDSPASKGETTVDGAGGTLVPGMYEMHAHLGQGDALLQVLAGITTVRDMGNDNAVLDALIHRIDAGEIGGPRVVRSGFIEGKSPFSAQHGFVVDSEAAALDAVRWYGARGFWQIKVYNSMNPAWVPAIVAQAHRLGMRVAGHVPAFSTADAMIAAGYDEMTHINQFVLGWVIKPSEDTRTLFRLTALKRLAGFDLDGAAPRATIAAMVAGGKAIDPTLGIHENLTQNRDGHVPPGAVDYLDHMPIGFRRDAMKAWVDTSAPGDDAAYRAAFETLVGTVRKLHDAGVFIVFGTDTGGSFSYHRELELYQRAGFTAPEILKRATYDSARYLGVDQSRGTIERGKLADFFLVPGDPTRELKAIKTIRMVVKDGVFYYPTEAYPRFGIKPFTTAPTVTPVR